MYPVTPPVIIPSTGSATEKSRGFEVHIGSGIITLENPAMCEYLEALYNSGKDYGIYTMGGLFVVRQYYSNYNGGREHMGVLIERPEDTMPMLPYTF